MTWVTGLFFAHYNWIYLKFDFIGHTVHAKKWSPKQSLVYCFCCCENKVFGEKRVWLGKNLEQNVGEIFGQKWGFVNMRFCHWIYVWNQVWYNRGIVTLLNLKYTRQSCKLCRYSDKGHFKEEDCISDRLTRVTPNLATWSTWHYQAQTVSDWVKYKGFCGQRTSQDWLRDWCKFRFWDQDRFRDRNQGSSGSGSGTRSIPGQFLVPVISGPNNQSRSRSQIFLALMILSECTVKQQDG